ncbi:MAG TPA: diaminopimelate decarboxylase [Terriglobales bacterium]|nr:diaminopimelate decarboxylase [Terriglobales bacterium]
MRANKNELVARPPAFTYRAGLLRSNASLHCDSVPVSGLVKKHGTPLYVYSASTIRDRYIAFDRTFGDFPHTICYSVKANSNLSILRMLAKLGAGFDVVSGGELERVLRADKKSAKNVVFSGVGKTVEEIDLALRSGILMFNAESESEVLVIAERAARLKQKAPIALRVNPDVPADTHPYISTGLHKHKFGVPLDVARRLYRKAAELKHLDVVGVSAHIGSQITDVVPFAAAVSRLADLVRKLRAHGLAIKYVDAGGGLGIPYNNTTNLPEFAAHAASYALAVTKPLQGMDVHLLLEPGRSIVGPAGALITRVLYRKGNNGKRFLVVDAAMNDLIRPSLYGAHHDIVPVVISKGRRTAVYDVVGPICETGDFFARDRELPAVEEGEFLAILDTGAYGMSISSNYNTRRRAAEIMVDGRNVKEVRRRDSIADMLKNEL